MNDPVIMDLCGSFITERAIRMTLVEVFRQNVSNRDDENPHRWRMHPEMVAGVANIPRLTSVMVVENAEGLDAIPEGGLVTMAGFHLFQDPDIPLNEAHLIGVNDKLLAKLVHVGVPERYVPCGDQQSGSGSQG